MRAGLDRSGRDVLWWAARAFCYSWPGPLSLVGRRSLTEPHTLDRGGGSSYGPRPTDLVTCGSRLRKSTKNLLNSWLSPNFETWAFEIHAMLRVGHLRSLSYRQTWSKRIYAYPFCLYRCLWSIIPEGFDKIWISERNWYVFSCAERRTLSVNSYEISVKFVDFERGKIIKG